MLYTKTDVFNIAAGELGLTIRIVNADTDSSTTANTFRREYEMAVSDVLNMHEWVCQNRRSPLSLIQISPTTDWAYAYDVPEDCQTLIEISQDNFFPQDSQMLLKKTPFEEVTNEYGTVIHCNLDKAWGRYTARPSQTPSLKDYFAQAIGIQLAVRCAPALITNNWLRIKEQFLKDARSKISAQIATDITKQPDPTQEASYSPFARARIN